MSFRESFREVLSSQESQVLTLTQRIKLFIQIWDMEFPIDYWWRKKYNVPFGSPTHKAMTFIEMKIDHEEDKIAKRAYWKSKYKDENDPLFMDQEEGKEVFEDADELFDSIDIGKMNEQINKK